jgi:signal transduction histidine kinase
VAGRTGLSQNGAVRAGPGLFAFLRRAPLPGAERQRAAAAGAVTVLLFGAVDLAAEGALPRRAAIWGAWAAFYALQSLLLRRAPASRIRWLSAAGAVAAVAALLALVELGGGSGSPFFAALPTVPLLMATVEPEEAATVGVAGLLIAGGGMVLLWREAASPGFFATWGTVVAGTTCFSIYGSLRHLARSDRAVAVERDRVEALARLAESRRAQERAEHLASVGLVADGVAHEMNGPLASARSNVSYARQELQAGHPDEADDALSDAEAALERIREVSSTLQILARPEPEARALCAVDAAVAEAVRLAALRLGQAPEVELRLPPGLPPMFAVRRELVDLLFHLVLVAAGRGAALRPVCLAAAEAGAGMRIEVSSAVGLGDDPGTRLSVEVCRAHARRMGGELRTGTGAGPGRLVADLPLSR